MPRKHFVPYLLGVVAAVVVASCSQPTPEVTQDAMAKPAAGPTLVRGTVTSVSDTQLAIKTPTGDVTVRVAQPFKVYDRVPGDLKDVTDTSFVGVTSVKQPDGTEKATEIHVFPEELRGLGEGSHMMDTTANATPSRMTNGKVASPETSPSRMSNGNVKNTGGSTIAVQYQGGVQNVTVPQDVTVTKLQLSPQKLASGESVVVLAEKSGDGSLTSSKALLAGK
jgi:hypothetical protein